MEPAARLRKYTIPWGLGAIFFWLAFTIPVPPVNRTNPSHYAWLSSHQPLMRTPYACIKGSLPLILPLESHPETIQSLGARTVTNI